MGFFYVYVIFNLQNELISLIENIVICYFMYLFLFEISQYRKSENGGGGVNIDNLKLNYLKKGNNLKIMMIIQI